MAHAGGRPPHWKTPEALQADIDAYFAVTPIEEQMITGLCIHLDIDRVTLLDYNEKDEFSSVVKKAKTRIEHAWERRLMKQGRSGDIFALKQFKWKDQNSIEHSGEIKLPKPIADISDGLSENNGVQENSGA